MGIRGDPAVEHVLRRLGFGASDSELSFYADASPAGLIDALLNYERLSDAIDSQIGQSAYAGVVARSGPFSPNTVINDARQRELFRMVHSARPLQEKMALFWHNHFATAYSKIAGAVGGEQATKMMAARPSEVAGRQRGQYELFRQMATGNYRDLLVEVARDPAMLVWLDGRLNVRGRPQENFARELMELFTIGVGEFTEADVYAAARVFTGWNLRLVGQRSDPEAYYEFIFNPAQHDTDAKTFSFPVAGGSHTIPARPASDGMQDGLDLIGALARHPLTARRLAERLYAYFVSETVPPAEAAIQGLAGAYLGSGLGIKAMLQHLFTQPYFTAPAVRFTRYAWPVEFVVRAIKETGWNGLSLNIALTPLANMGQQLYEPPDVNGWALGPGWISTSAMLARMNFASALMGNQKFNLGREAQSYRRSPDDLVAYLLQRFAYAPLGAETEAALVEYARAGGWAGSDGQLNAKAAGLARLIVASAEYQFN